MADEHEESERIARCRNGDHAAFELLVQAHQRMVFSIIYRMTGSVSDAEDLTQETFLRAHQQLESFRGESKFSTWLGRIAVNLSLNWRAREGRRGEIHARWAQDAIVDGGAAGELPDELSRRVQAALQRLPGVQRAALILTAYENQSHAEAARALNCNEATISWRVFAARQKLKRWLKGVS
ncbi:MAG TPA: sigma-70 family RNA polymerase sigma factor [Verrucomicrobiae bacterium]|jgi:RNA polymerase sigma-70 factor (ECF subfamily)